MKSNIAVIISIVIAVSVGTQADCPTQCPHGLIDPVCGSDDRLYYSECHMERQNCGLGVTKVAWSDCTANCKNVACTMEYSPRCGSNGIRYGNKCTLLWASCGRPEPIKELPLDQCPDPSHE